MLLIAGICLSRLSRPLPPAKPRPPLIVEIELRGRRPGYSTRLPTCAARRASTIFGSIACKSCPASGPGGRARAGLGPATFASAAAALRRPQPRSGRRWQRSNACAVGSRPGSPRGEAAPAAAASRLNGHVGASETKPPTISPAPGRHWRRCGQGTGSRCRASEGSVGTSESDKRSCGRDKKARDD